MTRVSGGVGREFNGEVADANHMVGVVDLDGRYVVDAGLGDGPLAPFPLDEHEWNEGSVRYGLEQLDRDWWRFPNDPNGMASSYDFTLDPMSLGDYQERCTLLQTDPESTFVKFAIVSRRNECGYEVLRNVTHIEVVDGETSKRHITDVDDYRDTLARLLGVDLGDEVDTLWTIVNERVAAQAAVSDQRPADEVR